MRITAKDLTKNVYKTVRLKDIKEDNKIDLSKIKDMTRYHIVKRIKL